MALWSWLGTHLLMTKKNAFRFVVMLLFLFWQGGFLFYSTVVINVASEQLGSHRESGFITQHVSNWLNAAATPALIALLLNWYYSSVSQKILRRVMLGTWVVMFVALVATVALHPSLDAQLVAETHGIPDKKTFRLLHQIYLNITTVQWAAAMVHLWCVVANWSVQERPT